LNYVSLNIEFNVVMKNDIMIVIYVNDLIFTRFNLAAVFWLKNVLNERFTHVDDERFREALIRNDEICDVDDINERIEIEMIWLKKDVFIYKQRVFRFEMFRFENQKNQWFDRFFVNFRSFDSDCLDSNNLSTLRRFERFFCSRRVENLWMWNLCLRTWWSICVWISWLMKRVARRRWIKWLFVDFVFSFASLLFVNLNVLTRSWKES
jgi:hypothetical protein